jgi:hypothetical protein
MGKIPLEKPLRENQFLVDFINIKYGISSWDNGPLEESTKQEINQPNTPGYYFLCFPFAPFLVSYPCTLG